MEPFGRINFWMVIFCVCFPANALPIGGMEDSNIDMMRAHVKCEQDAEFYTPTNIKPECFTSALRCFKAELKTVKKECLDSEDVIMLSSEYISMLMEITKSRESNSTTCPCESWPEKPFPNYLDAMESLLQHILSIHSQAQ